MKEEKLNQWLTEQEAVRCAFGDHSNHTHEEEVTSEEVNE